MNDLVNNPPHYRGNLSGVECINITEHLNFNRGNAIKYAWRAESKGAHLQDLNKCVWYLEREIKRLDITDEPTFHAHELDKYYDKMFVYYRDYCFDKRLIEFIECVAFGGQERLAFAIKIVESWIRELTQ